MNRRFFLGMLSQAGAVVAAGLMGEKAYASAKQAFNRSPASTFKSAYGYYGGYGAYGIYGIYGAYGSYGGYGVFGCYGPYGQYGGYGYGSYGETSGRIDVNSAGQVASAHHENARTIEFDKLTNN